MASLPSPRPIMRTPLFLEEIILFFNSRISTESSYCYKMKWYSHAIYSVVNFFHLLVKTVVIDKYL